VTFLEYPVANCVAKLQRARRLLRLSNHLLKIMVYWMSQSSAESEEC
jgi:hypothetical protein